MTPSKSQLGGLYSATAGCYFRSIGSCTHLYWLLATLYVPIYCFLPSIYCIRFVVYYYYQMSLFKLGVFESCQCESVLKSWHTIYHHYLPVQWPISQCIEISLLLDCTILVLFLQQNCHPLLLLFVESTNFQLISNFCISPQAEFSMLQASWDSHCYTPQVKCTATYIIHIIHMVGILYWYK